MPFSNPIIGGGGALIRDAIQSPNYVPGVSGWSIKRNGDVEFADGSFRGDISGATGTFDGEVPIGALTSGTLTATMTTQPAGARTIIDGTGVRSSNYIPGASGWAVKNDGTAEFGNATVRGKFITGSAGGANTYVDIDDNAGGSEIRVYNPAGTDYANIASPLAGSTGDVPTVELTSGYGRIGSSIYDGRARAQVSPDFIYLVIEKAANQPAGGNLILSDGGAVVGANRPSDSAQDGGELRVTTSGWELTADVAGVNFDQMYGSAAGIGVHGRLISSAASGTFAGAGWQILEERVRQWGPLVFLHLNLRRTGAAIPAGVVAASVIATITDGLPLSQTSCAAQWSGGIAGVNVNSLGEVGLRWVSTNLATNADLRVNAAYWGNPAP